MTLIGKKTRRILERIAVALEQIARRIEIIQGGELTFSGLTGGNMFVLPDDQPDVPFTVSPLSATDAEGHAIPLTELLTSDDETVVSFVFADGSDATNPRAGVAHIGAPGVANINYTAKDPAGNIVKSAGAQFTITTGAVANVSGGDLAFEDITES